MATLTAGTNPAAITTTGAGRHTVSDRLNWLLAYAKTAFAVYAERRELQKLSDSQLQDIGITRAQMQCESNRSFFDLPER
jgi:hypothetical protein